MRLVVVLAAFLVVGCSSRETIRVEHRVSEETVTVRVPAVTERMPARSAPDALAIVTEPSALGRVTVRADTAGESEENIATVRKVLRDVSTWTVQLDIQPPPVTHNDVDTTEVKTVVTREESLWEKIQDFLPLALLLVFALVLLYIVRGR